MRSNLLKTVQKGTEMPKLYKVFKELGSQSVGQNTPKSVLNSVKSSKLVKNRYFPLFLTIFVVLIVFALYLLLKPAPSAVMSYSFNSANTVDSNNLSSTEVIAQLTENSIKFTQDNNVVTDYSKTLIQTDIDQHLLTTKVNNQPVQFDLSNTNAVQTVFDNNKVTFNNVYNGVNLEYKNFADYIKETITLVNESSQSTITFSLKLDSEILLTKDDVGGVIATRNAQNIFYVHPLSAWDNNQTPIDFVYSIEKTDTGYKLTVSPKNINDLSGKTYPITIDPTISWTFTSATGYTLSDPTKIEIVSNVVRLKDNAGIYATDNPYVVTNTPINFSALSNFIETLGSGNQGTVRYQLSKDKNTWYYFNGTSWLVAQPTDYNLANTAAVINTNISAFVTAYGSGSLYVKAFLHATSASTPVELQSFNLTYTTLPSPTISSVTANTSTFDGNITVTVAGTNFDTLWPYRKKISIDKTKVSGSADLQNFVVLINRIDTDLKYTANGGKVGKINGGDIKFTLSDGITKLNYEMEKYDPTTGEIVAWVNVPNVFKSINTDMYIYYGNAAAANQWNPTAVWGSNYKAVYHLGDASPSDTFTTLDTNKWGFWGSPVLNAGRVQCSVAVTTAWANCGINTLYGTGPHFFGDFDIQFDFDISGWTNTIPTDSHEVVFQMQPTVDDGSQGGPYGYYVTYQKFADGSKSYNTWNSETNAGWGASAVSLTSGKLRMTRSGSTLTAYGWNGTAWNTLGTFTSASAGKEMFFNFYTSNRTSGTAMQNMFIDNFTVNKGAPIKDSTANRNYGANYGGTLSTGGFGNGYNFDGASKYIEIRNSASLENIQENNFSLESWFKSTDTPPVAQPNNIYSLIMKSGYHEGLAYGQGYYAFYHWLTGNVSAAMSTPSTFPYTAPTLSVGVMDRVNGKTNITVNNQKSTATWTPNAVSFEYNQLPWRIGVAEPTNPQYTWSAKGNIDEVRIINGTLSDDLIATEYANESSPTTFLTVGAEEKTVSVSFGGVLGTNTTVVNSTTITTIVPPHSLGTVDVTVTNPDFQSATLTSGFTYTSIYSAPTITNVTPQVGPTSGKTNVTITGTNFLDPTAADANTKLLLHSDGTGNTYVDSSPSPQTITPTGSTQTTLQSKFGIGSSNVTDTKFVSWSSTAASTFVFASDFTIDYWMYRNINSNTADGSAFVLTNGTTYLAMNSAANGFNLYLNSATPTVNIPNVYTPNTWNHFALVRSGTGTNNLKLYVNGIVVYQTTNTSTLGYANPTSARLGGGAAGYDAYVDDVRVENGTALYTNPFTPSTVPTVRVGGTLATNVKFINSTTLKADVPAHSPGVTTVNVINRDGQSASFNSFTYNPLSATLLNPAIGPSLGATPVTITGTSFTDPTINDADTTLLIRADGNGTTFTDSSVVNQTLVSSGGATQAATQFKSGTGAVLVSDTKTVSWNATSGSTYVFPADFTLDLWQYRTTANGTLDGSAMIFGNGTTYFGINTANGGINLYLNSASPINIPAVYANNVWNHFAFVRSGTGTNNIKVYVNGVQVYQTTNTATLGYVGGPYARLGGGNAGYEAYIDDARISNVARWTSAFTAPRTSSVTFGGATSVVNFVNTTTLLATTPTHASGLVDVVITNPDTEAVTLTGAYNYSPLPAITQIVPSTVSKNGGDIITVTGNDFIATPTVTVSGTAATNVSYVNATTLNITVPVHINGPVNVVITNPDGQSVTATGMLAYVNDAPTVTNVNPNKGSVSGGNSVTITGTNFENTYNFPNCDANTVGLWHLEDGTTTLTDSCSTNTGTATGTTSVSGTNGKGRLFNGTSDVVKVSDATALKPTAQLSVEAWFNTTDVTRNQDIVSKTQSGNYSIVMNTVGTTGCSSTSICFAIFTAGAYKGVNIPISMVKNNTWYYVAGTYDGVNLKIYLNGTLITTSATTGAIGTSVSPLCIGGEPNASTCTDGTWFKGTIDEVRLSNIGRTQAEITANYTYNKHKVMFGNVEATNVNIVNSTTLTAITPVHVGGLTNVSVINPDTQTGTLTNAYNYAAPTITSLNPSKGPSSGGTSVTITGDNYDLVNTNASICDANTGAFWHFEETSGNVTDMCNGLVGTPTGAGTSSIKGSNGNGRFFNGGANYITVPHNSLLKPSQLSVSFWFRPDDLTSDQRVISATQTGSYNVSMNVNPSDAPNCAPTDLCFIGLISGAYKGVGYPLSNFKQGQWYHFAGTYDGANFKMYINSVLVKTVAQTGSITNVDEPLCIGSESNTGVCSGGPYYKGGIDELWISKVARTQSEIQAEYNATRHTVKFGGVEATNVKYINATTLTADTPANLSGTYDVAIINPDNQSQTLPQSFLYVPDKFVFISSANTVRATEPITMTVQAQDALGNPVLLTQDATLDLTSTQATGFFAIDENEDESTKWNYSTILIPAGTSSATFYYKDNQKGTPTISATLQDATATLPATKLINVKSRYVLVVTGVTDPVKSGVPSSVTILSTDYNGQPLHDYAGTVTFTSNDISTVLPNDFKFETAMLGEHTFVNGITMVTQGESCITVTDTLDSDITGSQCNISVTPPNAGTISKLKILNGTQGIALDGRTTEISIQTQDVSGVAIPVGSSTSIYLYTDSLTGQFSTNGTTWVSGPLTLTIPQYATSRNFYYKDPTLGNHIITVRDDATANSDGSGTNTGWENDTATITTATGSAYKLSIGGITGSVAAGTVSTAYTVSQQDVAGNNLTAIQDRTVFLTVAPGTGLLSVDGLTNWSTSINTKIRTGNLYATFFFKSNNATTYSITTSDAYPADGNTGLLDETKQVQVVAASATKLVLTTAPAQVVAGDISNVINVQLQDNFNNPANVASNFDIFLSATNTNALFSATSFETTVTQLTIPAGQNSKDFYLKQTKYFSSQTIFVADTIDGFGAGGLTDTSASINILPGTVSKLDITNPSNINVVAGVQSSLINVVTLNNFNIQVPVLSDLPLYFYSDSSGSLKEFSLLAEPSWSPITTFTMLSGTSSADFYYKDSKVGTSKITVSDDTQSDFEFGITNDSLNIDVSANVPSKLKFTSTASATEVGSSTNAITITLNDQYNNIAKSNGATLINLATNSANANFDTLASGAFNGSVTTVTVPDQQNSVSFFYKDFVTGTPTITATSNLLTTDSQVQNIIAGVVSSFTFTVNNSTLTAGTVSDSITVRSYNSSGVNIYVGSNLTINLASSNVSGRFDNTDSGSFDGSITNVVIPSGSNSATFYYKDTKAGSLTITGSRSGLANSTTNLTVTGSTPAKFAFKDSVLQTLSIGQKSNAITIQVQDEYGNPVNPLFDTNVFINSSSGTGVFYNASNAVITNALILTSQSEANIYYKDTVIGSPLLTSTDYIVADEGDPDQGLTDVTKNITIVYGNPSKFALTSGVSNLEAGTPALVTVKLLNDYSLEVPAIANTDVNLSTSTATGKFDITSNGSFNKTTVTVNSGSSSANFYYKDTVTGNAIVTAYKNSYTPGSVAFNLTGSIVYRILFETAPQTVTAGNSSTQYIVRFRDQFGNYTTAFGPFSINLQTSDSSNGKFDLGGNTWNETTVNVIGGNTSASFYYKDTIAGAKTLTISSNLLLGDNQTATIIANAPKTVSFSSDISQNIIVQSPSNKITIVLHDQYGNVAKAIGTTRFNLTSSSSNAQFSISNSSWSPITFVDISLNASIADIYYKDFVVGNPTITATHSLGTIPAIHDDVTIIPGNATKLYVTSAAKTALVNTPTSAITYYVADLNNYKTQIQVDSQVLVTSSSITGQFSVDNGTTWSSSLNIPVTANTDTQKSFLYLDSNVGNPIITISMSGLSNAAQTETINAGTIQKISVTAIDTTVAGTIIPVTIETQNTLGDLAAVQNNTVFTLVSTNTSGQFSLSDITWSPITEFTLLKWQNSKTIYYKDTTANTPTVSADEKISQGWTIGTKQIAINAGDYYKIVYLQKPAAITADTVSTPFRIQTTDEFGNLVTTPEREVYVFPSATGQLSLDGSTNWVTTSLPITLLDGASVATFYYKDTFPGNTTITTSDQSTLDIPDTGKINANATVTINGQVPAALRITTSAYTGAQKITAGQITNKITIEAYKQDNTPAIIGVPLSINLGTTPTSAGSFKLSSDISGASVTSVQIPTGSTSVDVYFTSNIAGNPTMNISALNITGDNQSVEIIPDVAHHFKFMTAAQSKSAGVESDSIRIQLQDQFNNATTLGSDLVVTLSTSSSTGKFSLLNGASWSDVSQAVLSTGNSDLYVYYKDVTSGSFTIKADETPSVGLAQDTQSFTVNSGAVNSIKFLSTSNSLQANQASTLMTVSLYDVFGNVTTSGINMNVYLYSSSGTGSFASDSLFTNAITNILVASGHSTASFYYKDLTQNNAIVTVSDQSLLDSPDIAIVNATQTQNITWGNVTRFKFINDNASVAAGDVKTLQLRLQNAYNAIVQTASPITVYLSSSSSNGLFSMGNTFNPGEEINANTISANTNGFDLYYKDTKAASVTLTASDVSTPAESPDTGITNATFTYTIQSAALAKFVYITSAQNLIAGQTSSLIIVQARDIYGNIKTLDNSTPLYLYSSSATAQFSLSTDFSVPNRITQTVINSGFSTTAFYYKDFTYVNPSAYPRVTVSNQFPQPQTDDSIIDAVQIHSISAGNITKIKFSPSTDLGTIVAGSLSTGLTAIFANQYDVEIPLTSSKTIYLFTNSSGGQFADFSGGTCGTFGISSIDLNASKSRFTLCYRDSTAGTMTITASDTNVSSPDTAWTNAVGTISVDPGIITQLVFLNSSPQNIVARHASTELKVETRNTYGNPTAVISAKTIYVRSTSGGGEFAVSPVGPWGINFVTIPAGQTSTSLYYRDSIVSNGVTITAADTLPLLPDINWTNTSLTANITKQSIDNFLVTNISDPQIQGNPSSVVVMARDAENYAVDWYTGTISFASSDGAAVLPGSYTFTAEDKGIKTFNNGVSFSVTGEEYVRVVDDGGVIGQQNNITVVNNSAGPINKIKFKDTASPLYVQKDLASSVITVQLQDINDQGTNAGVNGFPIKLTSDSATALYSLSPIGPWTSTGTFNIPQAFNSLNIYYKDSTAGTPNLTVSDWIGGTDDAGIQDDSLQLIVNSLVVNVITNLQVNDNKHEYVNSPMIFGKDETGYFFAKAAFQISTVDALTGLPQTSNITVNWKDPSGNIIKTESSTGINSYVFSVDSIEGTASNTNYSLEVIANAPSTGYASTTSTNVPVSGWSMDVFYDENNKIIGNPLPFTIRTKFNGTLADPLNFSLNFRDNNGNDLTDSQYVKYKIDLTKSSTGVYTGQFDTNGLTPNLAYYLYGRMVDAQSHTLAEDNHHDIFFKNNVVLAPKGFAVTKVLTSTVPAAETYNLNFNWSTVAGATKYTLYKTRDKSVSLYQDVCSVNQIRQNHRNGDTGAVDPLCETTIQQHVGTNDQTEWVAMATINAPATSYTLPWASIQTDLPNTVYYYVLRAENGYVESAYSTMSYTNKASLTFNPSPVANVNWVSMPFVSQYKKASDVVNEIEGGLEGVPGDSKNKRIDSITLWDSHVQGSTKIFYYNSDFDVWTGDDFDITQGDGLSIVLSGKVSTFNWTVSGTDSVSTQNFSFNTPPVSNVNWVSVPYSTKFKTASEVVLDLEGSLEGTPENPMNKKIDSITLWDPSVQGSTKIYYYNSDFDVWTGDDFDITPGTGFSLVLSGRQVTNFDWKHILVINPYL